jgi:protein TonB
MQTADETFALSERLVPPSDRGQRAFLFALGFAFFFHAALFVQLARTVPQKTLGDRSGVDDAISVELVTAADLRSLESVASPPPGAQAPPSVVPPQPKEPPPEAPQAAPEPPKPEATPPPEPAPKAAEPAPVEPAPKQPPPPEEKSALPDFESALPDLATLPQPTDPPEKTAEPQKKTETSQPEKAQEPAKPAEAPSKAPPAKKVPQQQARLQPTPQDLSSAPPGRSTAATRPPGITRSGENDEFGRGVIRALRQTMPAPNGVFGRVTVRLILNENGDLAQVQVLEPSGRAGLDQSVVFATKQTYFPLPPYKSTVADRTFVITYVYR